MEVAHPPPPRTAAQAEAEMTTCSSRIAQQIPTIEAFFVQEDNVKGWVNVEGRTVVGHFQDRKSWYTIRNFYV